MESVWLPLDIEPFELTPANAFLNLLISSSSSFCDVLLWQMISSGREVVCGNLTCCGTSWRLESQGLTYGRELLSEIIREKREGTLPSRNMSGYPV
jgi:hypothetical protein